MIEDSSFSDEILANHLLEIYLQDIKIVLKGFLDKWRKELTGKVSKINIKELSSRWGSCSSTGTISLNWRLIMAPDDVFEYVFIHEIAHLRVKGHNREFWDVVAAKCDNYQAKRRYLKDNTFLLMNFPKLFLQKGIFLQYKLSKW